MFYVVDKFQKKVIANLVGTVRVSNDGLNISEKPHYSERRKVSQNVENDIQAELLFIQEFSALLQ